MTANDLPLPPHVIVELLPVGRAFGEVRVRVLRDADNREWVEADWFVPSTASALGFVWLRTRTDYLTPPAWAPIARAMFPKRKASNVWPDDPTVTYPTLSRDERLRVLRACGTAQLEAAIAADFTARALPAPYAVPTYTEVVED